MPDPARKTISATEVPALFCESSYLTRWMLYQRLASGVSLDFNEDERMREGRRMQPLIAERTAGELKLAVEQNESDRYISRGFLGCTRDAQIIDPERGPGALEIKCVFDYRTWMDRWHGGSFVPREYEIQLQTQMYVGDGREPFAWGLLAVWVCAHQYYFERAAQESAWQLMSTAAGDFLGDVAAGREPDPLGVPIELPLLAELYPTITGSLLDLRENEEAESLVPKVHTYLSSKATENANKGVAASIRAEFIGLLRGAETLLLPGGSRVSYKKGRIDMWAPEEAP